VRQPQRGGAPGCRTALPEANASRAAARLLKDKTGVAAIEYGLLSALIGVALVTGVTEVGSGVSEGFTQVEEEVAKAVGNKGGNGKGRGKGKGKGKGKRNKAE
jgi:pilus assembly protein Flp/PilA